MLDGIHDSSTHGRVHMLMKRTVPSVGLLMITAACTSWHLEAVSPQALIATRHPSQVRVTLAGGERLVIRGPRVVADSLLGIDVTGERKGLFVAPLLVLEGRRTPIGLPLAAVRGVATRRVSALKTGLYAGSMLAVSVAAIAIISGGCVSLSCQ